MTFLRPNNMFDISCFVRVADGIRKEIENELISIGILCRVFGREKVLNL